MEKLHDGLYVLGRKERLMRQKAKEEAQNYNRGVSEQIHKRYYDVQKEAAKMGIDATHEFHVTWTKIIH